MRDKNYNKRQKYNTVGHQIDPNGEAVEADCVDVMFINYGTSVVFINNYLRIPAPAAGQFTAFTIRGNTGEIDKTIYNISFTPGAIAGNNCVMMYRQYID